METHGIKAISGVNRAGRTHWSIPTIFALQEIHRKIFTTGEGKRSPSTQSAQRRTLNEKNKLSLLFLCDLGVLCGLKKCL